MQLIKTLSKAFTNKVYFLLNTLSLSINIYYLYKRPEKYIHRLVIFMLVSSNLFVEMETCTSYKRMYKLLVLANHLPKNQELFQTIN